MLRVNLQKAILHIEELIKENTIKKRMNDARLNEVQQIMMEIKTIDNKNQRTNEDNKQLAITVSIGLVSSRHSRKRGRGLRRTATGLMPSLTRMSNNSRR